ncbi:MAG: ATP synthase F1 subunit delta [Cyanobacteria bacterium SZAS LIN-3]|nr:ATP synthase F1 subunit delta [Cyanobacteria bacterium SZAS LIN-3]MBS2009258.1 ATP synthase F1 subunit delta [Cyanobacteria bacterium SZAS TMP-1]
MNTELQGIASKYAEAVLDLAGNLKSEDRVLDEIKLVSDVIASDREMTIIINHPAIDSAEKKRFLSGLFEGKISELTANLIGLLADKRRLDLIPFIETGYRELLNKRKNIVSASLVCAERLADTQVANIKAQLAEHLGKTLELEVRVDPSLIGGVVLKMGDQVIDGSLNGQLKALEKQLLSV